MMTRPLRYSLLLFAFIFFVVAIAIALLFFSRGSFKDAEVTVPAGWQDSLSGQLILSHPESLPTTYIQALDWPPSLKISKDSYRCHERGQFSTGAGSTSALEIGGRDYCVTEMAEAAAGNIYTQYTYALNDADRTLILTFSTRVPNCGNYPEVERARCFSERETFNLDLLIDRIMRTVRERK